MRCSSLGNDTTTSVWRRSWRAATRAPLRSSTTATIRRWLKEGLLPGEQVTPHAPWRIRLSDEIRGRFVPEVPEGYLPLGLAHGVAMTRDVAEGQPLKWSDVAFDATSDAVKVRREMEAMFARPNTR